MEGEEQNIVLNSPLIHVCEGNENESRKKPTKEEIVAEVKRLFLLAGPLVSVNFLMYCTQVISVMFVGHLGELPLAGASMATSFGSVTGFNLLCLVKFLQSQNNVVPMMMSTGFTTLSHFLICWALVFKSGLGNKGAALANAISYWINVVLLATYVKFSPRCRLSWTGFSKDALQDVTKFLNTAIPSTIMICLEFWSFQMMVMLSGLLPNPRLETSVLSISQNTYVMVCMVPVGLGAAVSTRVSNELGAGRPLEARLAVGLVLLTVVIEGIFASVIMILGRNFWGYCYSKEVKVVKYVAEMLLLLALAQFFDGIQTVLSGVARGCGWQKIGAWINLGAYYLIGIPSAIILAFVFHIGGKGLWTGIILALFVQAMALLIITLCTNWEKEAKNVADRVYI
ncbi:Multi antimicrobial extrusion protein [Dillenia turbinata]|uniref:Multi antimicrobial extrusion protein n=1 Tax=Dillenia turbinata TaxID=194707 RepID=A0AAN8VY29_9MAGN